jgi:hypothetical protein
MRLVALLMSYRDRGGLPFTNQVGDCACRIRFSVGVDHDWNVIALRPRERTVATTLRIVHSKPWALAHARSSQELCLQRPRAEVIHHSLAAILWTVASVLSVFCIAHIIPAWATHPAAWKGRRAAILVTVSLTRCVAKLDDNRAGQAGTTSTL